MGIERDWWVDGHFISAYTPEQACAEVRNLYGYNAEIVRPWTEGDA